MELRHICEVCGRDEVLTPEAALESGWDYPPNMGAFGVVAPRKCGDCGIRDTLWWALAVEHVPIDQLSSAQHTVAERIHGEPESILISGDDE
ncbi:hypothetical protein [Gordonia sp. (in: high G+C Gram-positive bacteria)]|uniref:hypothetical protein n=1 Tax=Gordonia sp. (in: high G+C Gram-positive bacteria) TaxID=84139 RepID=UPI0039E24257